MPTNDQGAPPPAPGRPTWPLALLALFFAGAGALHFIVPHYYERIVPPWLPNAPLIVAVSGVAEVFGAIGVIVAWTRRAAGWGLIVLLIAVFPANVQMLRLAIAANVGVAVEVALWVRLPVQGVLIWWVWRAALASGQRRRRPSA